MTIDWPLPESADSVPALDISAHGTALTAGPRRLTIDGEMSLSASDSLPFRSASCDEVICVDVLEVVRDDEALVQEIARILRPGGMLKLRTVAASPLGAFDSANLYRYLRDMSRRGQRPIELAESGWRRHYGRDELSQLLGDNGIALVSCRSYGLAVTELADFSAMVAGRWVMQNEDAYLRMRRGLNRLRERERRLPIPRTGFWLDAVGRRL